MGPLCTGPPSLLKVLAAGPNNGDALFKFTPAQNTDGIAAAAAGGLEGLQRQIWQISIQAQQWSGMSTLLQFTRGNACLSLGATCVVIQILAISKVGLCTKGTLRGSDHHLCVCR